MNIKAIAKEVLEFLVYLIIMVAAVFALRHFVVESFRVDGHSMDYTLQHDERLFMWKLAKIERFDVVVIKAPSDPSKSVSLGCQVTPLKCATTNSISMAWLLTSLT